MDFSKNVNEINSLKDLQEILDSGIGDLVKELDAKDGSYDGSVSLDIYNEWRASKGYSPIELPEGVTSLPFIDVVKGCYGIIRQEKIKNVKIDY